MDTNEFGYFAKAVSLELDINTNTLRRWSIALEHEGYQFERNDKDQRIYYQHDFRAFKEIKQLLASGVSMETAVKAVVANFSNHESASQTLSVHQQTPSVHLQTDSVQLSVHDLQELIQQEVQKGVQEAIQQEREAMFEAFERRMNDSAEKRDYELIKAIRETQQLIAATSKEEVEKNKSSFFKRLFKK